MKNNHSPQEQLGEKGITMSSPPPVAKKKDYAGMSLSNQKHTPVDTSCYICKGRNLKDTKLFCPNCGNNKQ